MNAPLFHKAFKATLPVLFGYIPLGMAFGMLFNELGFHWIYASIMSVMIYAGAGQFMAVGLLANHAGLIEVAITTLLLNSRHLFYGISLLNKFKTRGWRKLYLIFGLTDETYSLLTGTQTPSKNEETNFYLLITVLNHSYWIIGSTIGAILGANMSVDTTGLDFTLPALFMVLAIEQYKVIRESRPFILACIIAFMSIWLFSRDNMLLMSILLSIITLLLVQHKQRPNKHISKRGS